MASKYIKKFKVPNHFEDILSDFAKEILRNQPKDIIDFGIEYFKGLESSGKFKYIEQGENPQEKYSRSKNQKPDIINVQNNIEISTGDRNRFQQSIDKKIKTINNGPGPDKVKETNSRYGRTNDNEDHKKDYDDWFTKHSLDKQAIDYKRGEEEPDKNLKRNEMGYNTWFNNHSVRSNEQSQSGEMRREGSGGYDEWFTKHSIDKQVIDYKRGEEEPDKNLKRNEMGYNTWFNNHSVRSNDQSQSGEMRREGEGYDEWFTRHSKDKLVIDYKPKEEPFNKPFRCEVDYDTWFENHSKMTNK